MPAQSEARYEVGETFFQGNRFVMAIGRTKGIAGDVLVDFANPANSQIGTIVIDVSQLTSDENRRDNYIRNNGLESSKYPQATFVPTKIEGTAGQREARRYVDPESHRRSDGERNHQARDVRSDADGR